MPFFFFSLSIAFLFIPSLWLLLPCRYDMDGFYTPKNGKTYAHTGVMGYGRIRWVDMDAYEAAATATRSSPAVGGQGGGDDLSAQLARLLMGLDLTAPQWQQLQDGLANSGVLDKK
eukprot:COSAG04_NODE_212_length_20108_cov_107.515418_2_plen_116_part_00